MYEDASVRGILKSKAMPRLCETCGRKESAFGMPAEGKARWCDQRFARAPACATAMIMPPLLHSERKDSWGFSVFRIASAPACSACIIHVPQMRPSYSCTYILPLPRGSRRLTQGPLLSKRAARAREQVWRPAHARRLDAPAQPS